MEERLINIVDESIRLALKGKSKLSNDVLAIDGMSSAKVRHFLNNLIAKSEDVRYLEVGVWKGSTFVSALFENNYKYAVAIDNFSEFGGPKQICISNLKKFNITANKNATLICEKFEDVKLDKKFNIYFYDGNHTEESQIKAFEVVNDNLDDVFITIVDDWNHQRVKDGTRKAFEKLKYNVVKEWALHADKNGDKQNWWNGLYVAIIKK